MRKKGKVFLAFYMIVFALLTTLPKALAQGGLEYVYMFNLPTPSSQSMPISLWQMPHQGTLDTLPNSLNFAYLYQWQNPFNQWRISFWPYPWHYFTSYVKSKPKQEKSPFENPKIIKMGPLYAQLFEPYRYLFIADYEGADMEVHDIKGHVSQYANIFEIMLNPENFISDPNEIEDYWVGLGADPNLFGEEPDPVVSAILGRDFTVDINLPIFAYPNLQIDPNGPGSTAQRIIDQGSLGWNATIGGYGASGIQAFCFQSLQVYPYDGMPTYLPTYYAAIDAVKTYGKPYFNPTLVFFLESALWNAGVQVWPNIAAMDYTPQYFEDLIVTIEVSNGIQTDKSTFPITVVNYPVENYAPIPESADYEFTCYVGERFEYVLNCIDPDCFIFSMSPAPATTHTPAIAGAFRTDMDGLKWRDWPYDWCWMPYECERTINPCSGLFSWVPKWEWVYDEEITCSDARDRATLMTLKVIVKNK